MPGIACSPTPPSIEIISVRLYLTSERIPFLMGCICGGGGILHQGQKHRFDNIYICVQSHITFIGAVGIGMASKAVVWGVTSGAVGAAEAAGYVSLSRFFK